MAESGPRPSGAAIAAAEARVTGAVLGVAAVAWLITVALTRDAGMAMPASDWRLRTAVAFLVAWTVMMAAMMLPSVTPAARLWLWAIRGDTSDPSSRVLRMAAFVAGYLVSWVAVGVAALAVIVAGSALARTTPMHGRLAGAGLLVLAGAYQLTPLKQACLIKCRAPFGLFLTYSAFGPRLRDLRVGIHHGAYCVGCCWGLMAVLVAVGMTNLLLMAAVAGAVALEKAWSRGVGLSRWLGVVMIAAGLLALFVQGVAPGLSPPMGM
jgi:predicted metal-binding membrane protein